ncbi:MAG: DUF2075 domain-containing protein [Elainella sp. Prado103]|jgi:hypothetical protein|nr:DUF2075 domain-containing protein [Elainella sp. Prado103]
MIYDDLRLPLRWGWMGQIRDFLALPIEQWLTQLKDNYQQLYQQRSAPTQQQAWQDCGQICQQQLQRLVQTRSESQDWLLIFEYELLREGGRRPDLVLLAGDQILVLEFKQKSKPSPADLDQVAAYGRDLSEYHQASQRYTVTPLLVPTRSQTQFMSGQDDRSGVQILSPSQLAAYLQQLPVGSPAIDPVRWLASAYAPLPSIVQAARTLFQHEPLPQIKRAESAGISDLLNYLYGLVDRAKAKQQRHLVLITGVPGAGKTLVGLQFVYGSDIDQQVITQPIHQSMTKLIDQSIDQFKEPPDQSSISSSINPSTNSSINLSINSSINLPIDQSTNLLVDQSTQATIQETLQTTIQNSEKLVEASDSATASPHHAAIFLSGNGPLISVLQYALKSKVFVQAVRNFYLQYELRSQSPPPEHIIVFDEAQRAWDADRMADKYGIAGSATEVVLRIAARIPDWCVVVGLIGEGQEIHIGEEEGWEQWHQSLLKPTATWQVHGAPGLAEVFPDFPADRLHLHSRFNLTTSLRSHQASHLQTWVSDLLAGKLTAAADRMASLREQGFDAYVTRDLQQAQQYCRDRYCSDGEDRDQEPHDRESYDQEPHDRDLAVTANKNASARYGLIASSRARNLSRYGIPNDYRATAKLNVGAWYVDPPDSPKSCCAFQRAVTEFGCQGLELDFPIVGWGDDLRWQNAAWISPVRQRHAKFPLRLRLNSYRVLLTRGRDGLIVFVPPEAQMDETYAALCQAGLTDLQDG